MAKTIQQVTAEVRAVLEKCTCVGRLLHLPPGQLERKLYQDVNSCLEAAGGKWKKGLKAHEFNEPAHVKLAEMLTAGKITDHVKLAKVTRPAFYTPPDVAATVAMYAQPKGFFVLEPSAGHGALAVACMEYGARALLPMRRRYSVQRSEMPTSWDTSHHPERCQSLDPSRRKPFFASTHCGRPIPRPSPFTRS